MLFMFLFTEKCFASVSLQCETSRVRADGSFHNPRGSNDGVGALVGVSTFKTICDEGVTIEGIDLRGLMYIPFMHSTKYRLYCPSANLHDLQGTYRGIKGDLGQLLLDIGGVVLIGQDNDHNCYLFGYGFGFGLNIQIGNFTISRNTEILDWAHSYQEGRWVINEWPAVLCQKIERVINPGGDLSRPDNYQLSAIRAFMTEECPETFFPSGTVVLEMAWKSGIRSNQAAQNYNDARRDVPINNNLTDFFTESVNQ